EALEIARRRQQSPPRRAELFPVRTVPAPVTGVLLMDGKSNLGDAIDLRVRSDEPAVGRTEGRVVHTQRLEDFVLDKFRASSAADLPDDFSQERVPHTLILHARSGRKVERKLA